MFDVKVKDDKKQAVIKVIGVGGAGGNAVSHMLVHSITGVDFIVANTDAQVLSESGASTVIQLGKELTKGLGAGANPDVGRKAAEEDVEVIRNLLDGADMIFIAAGMGGGTGTGAAPVVARIAKELNILTVAVVSKPWTFEGSKRMSAAESGIAELAKYVDSLITVPNSKLSKVYGKLTITESFAAANDVLAGAVKGIADIITKKGLINLDFADVSTVMAEMGPAMMGTGYASGEERAEKASEKAIASPLLEDVDLTGARGILVNVTAGPDFSLDELENVGAYVRDIASETAIVVVGFVIDPELTPEDDIRVTIVATGLGGVQQRRPDLHVARPRTPVEQTPLPFAVEEDSVTLPSKPHKDIVYFEPPALFQKK